MRPQVQEQPGCSEAPPEYEGRLALDLILLDRARLFGALEAGAFELSNTRMHQNIVLHHLGSLMTESAIFLWELTAMVGRPYRCQGHSSLDAPSELNPPQRIPSPLYFALLVPQAEG